MAFRTQVNVPGDVFSTTPGCFVRFIRYTFRDTLNANILKQSADSLGLHGIIHNEHPGSVLDAQVLDAADDVIECTVTKSKERAAGSFTMTLAPGNINYHAAIDAGDHVLIFMKRDAGGGFTLTNDVTSGLKMWGIVQSVRVIRDVNESGISTVRYAISGSDFGHFFETDIYFNHIIAEQLKDDTLGMLHSVLNFVIDLDYASPSRNIEDLLNAFIGQFRIQNLPSPYATPNSPNAAFSLPGAVASFFGASGDARFTNVLQRQIGVLQYDERSTVPVGLRGVAGEAAPRDLTGTKFINIDTGSAFSLWSVIEAYGNALMNEFYADLLPNGSGKLVPTFVARQVPYTSTKAKPKIPIATTTYTSLPRVSLHEKAIFHEDFGRSESQRYNYIQLWGTGTLFDGSGDFQPEQTQKGNFAMDRQSVRRYGVKSLVRTTDYDLDLQALRRATQAAQKASDGSITFITDWAKIYADWYLPGHLYETGTVQCIGIDEPLAIGENLEIVRGDATKAKEIYHVQSYSHAFVVDGGPGVKQFRTTMSLVRGMTEHEKPIYMEVDHVGSPDITRQGQTNSKRSESKVSDNLLSFFDQQKDKS